jgi:hypothetical protein
MNEPTYHPELEALIRQVRTIDHEASGMLNAPAEVRGPGFFPGAWGGPDPSRAISQRPIMVLGQDQDNWVGFKKSMRKRTEEYSPTWRNLRVLLDQAAIDLDAVFLTNFIVGFRRQGFSTGPSPALASPAYLQASAQFFLYQLSIQRPRLIITLGVQPLVLLGLVSEFVLYRTVSLATFDDVAERGLAYTANVVFEGVPDITPTVVSICHPCYPQNGPKRRFAPDQPFHDEPSLLRFAFAQACGAGQLVCHQPAEARSNAFITLAHPHFNTLRPVHAQPWLPPFKARRCTVGQGR